MNTNNNNPSFDLSFVQVNPVPLVANSLPGVSVDTFNPVVDTFSGVPVQNGNPVVPNGLPISVPITPQLVPLVSPIVSPSPPLTSGPLKIGSPLPLSQSCPRSPPLVPRRRGSTGRKLPQRPSSSLSSRTPSPLVTNPLSSPLTSNPLSSPLTSNPLSSPLTSNPLSSPLTSPTSVSLTSTGSSPPTTDLPVIGILRPSSAPESGMKVKNGTTAPPVATIDTNQGSQKVGSELSCRNLCNGSDSQTDDTDPLLLHKSVFHNDIKSVFKLTQIPDCDINAKDKHGNTPLHLSVMLGHHEITELLLKKGAQIKVKNVQGWTPLSEAVSFGSRSVIRMILKELKEQSRHNIESRTPELIQALKLMGNFTMQVKWDFVSWIPLVSRILPSDVCKIYKKGSCIRCDTTLVDFSDMKWDRGDVSFIFNGRKDTNDAQKEKANDAQKEKAGDAQKKQANDVQKEEVKKPSLVVLDNKLKVYQYIRTQENDSELEDELDLLMSSDIVSAQMSTKNISFSRTLSGWLFKSERTEMIGTFLSNYYTINGFYVETKKRREHLSEEDLMKNKALIDAFTKGPSARRSLSEKGPFPNEKLSNGLGSSNNEKGLSPNNFKGTSANHEIVTSKKSDGSTKSDSLRSTSLELSTESLTLQEGLALEVISGIRRRSLSPPVKAPISWDTYVNCEPGNHPVLGRPLVCKSSNKSFKATLAMSADFPMTLESLLSVLEIIQPFKQFKKLKEFIQMKLPPGFPVKIDIPILPTVTAKITFQDFKYDDNMSDDLFSVPTDYVHDPSRFPDL